MKKILITAATWPLILVTGWFATRLSERYAAALDDLEFDFE